jgi:hypothetical protein
MDAGAVLVPVIPVVVGALVAVVPAYAMERRRERNALAVRWDSARYRLCADFASAVRQLLFMGAAGFGPSRL